MCVGGGGGVQSVGSIVSGVDGCDYRYRVEGWPPGD